MILVKLCYIWLVMGSWFVSICLSNFLFSLYMFSLVWYESKNGNNIMEVIFQFVLILHLLKKEKNLLAKVSHEDQS